jgi:putative Holliday junction resolvase
MRVQRLLGIDYGERRIGIARSDGAVVVPVTIIEHRDRASDLERVAEIARRDGVDAVIVGLPVLASGDEGEQARRCRRFGEALARRVGVPVKYHDETYTSADAETAAAVRSTGKRRNLDDLAAVLILESYLRSAAVAP